nr:MAG TPA_asm: hypothetical protein [Caudoviricetes sp.]
MLNFQQPRRNAGLFLLYASTYKVSIVGLNNMEDL